MVIVAKDDDVPSLEDHRIKRTANVLALIDNRLPETRNWRWGATHV